MKAGELFVDIKIAGSDKAIENVKSITASIKGAKEMSLEAKAAVVGFAYSIYKLASNASHDIHAMTLVDPNLIPELNKYKWAAASIGVTNDEITQSFVGLSKVVSNMRWTKEIPAFAKIIDETVGLNIDDATGKNGEMYLMGKLNEAATKLRREDVANFFPQFGLTNGTIESQIAGVFNNKKLMDSAPGLSRGEMETARGVEGKFLQMQNKFQIQMARTMSRHLPKLMPEISKTADALILLIDKLSELAEKLHVFEGIAEAMKAIGNTAGYAADQLSMMGFGDKNRTKALLAKDYEEWKKNKRETYFGEMRGKANAVDGLPAGWRAPMFASPARSGENKVIINMDMTVDGGDPQAVQAAAARGLEDAYNKMIAKKQAH